MEVKIYIRMTSINYNHFENENNHCISVHFFIKNNRCRKMKLFMFVFGNHLKMTNYKKRDNWVNKILSVFWKLEVKKMYNYDKYNHFENENNHFVSVNVFLLRKHHKANYKIYWITIVLLYNCYMTGLIPTYSTLNQTCRN